MKDPGDLTVSTTLEVRVTAVNDPPTVRVPSAVEFDEDGSYQLNMNDLVTDVDNTKEELTWTVAGNTNVQAEVRGGLISLRAPRNWNGREELTFTVSDLGGLSASTTTWVTVRPVNDPPVLSAIPAVTIDEDTRGELSLDAYMSDPDNTVADMTWRFTGQQNTTIEVSGGTAAITPRRNWSGREDISVSVTDPGGLQATGSFSVTVRPVNDPPVLQSVPDVEFPEDRSTSLDLAAFVSDPDNSPAQMTWRISGQENVNVQVTGARATFSAGRDWSGHETLTLVVSDPAGGTAQVPVSVNVRPVNDPPVLRPIPAQTFREDESASIAAEEYVSDVEGDPITWTGSSSDANVRADFTGGRLVFSAAPNWAGGPVTVTLTATDQAGGIAQRPVTVTVTPVNDPPSISEIEEVTFPENGTGTLDLSPLISDPDDNPAAARLSISGGSNVQVSIAGRTATFSAARYWNGTETLTLSATDPNGATGTRRFTVRVTPVNFPPTVTQPQPVRVREDETERVNLSDLASDPDDDQLTWSAEGSRQLRARVSGSTLEVSGTENWSGQGTVELTVQDPSGEQARTTLQVTVIPVNDPPRVRSIPDIRLEPEGSGRYDLSEYASDPEGDSIVWAVKGDTGGLEVSLRGTVLEIRVPVAVIGTIGIDLSVRDSQGAEAAARVNVVVVP